MLVRVLGLVLKDIFSPWPWPWPWRSSPWLWPWYNVFGIVLECYFLLFGCPSCVECSAQWAVMCCFCFTITVLVPALHTLSYPDFDLICCWTKFAVRPCTANIVPYWSAFLHPSYVCPSGAHFLPEWTNDAPHRALMSDSLIETLVYLKGNACVFWLC